MKPPALLSLMPRARRDIDNCIRFIAGSPRGKPQERRQDIYHALARICELPLLNAVEAYRPATGIELRRENARHHRTV